MYQMPYLGAPPHGSRCSAKRAPPNHSTLLDGGTYSDNFRGAMASRLRSSCIASLWMAPTDVSGSAAVAKTGEALARGVGCERSAERMVPVSVLFDFVDDVSTAELARRGDCPPVYDDDDDAAAIVEYYLMLVVLLIRCKFLYHIYLLIPTYHGYISLDRKSTRLNSSHW